LDLLCLVLCVVTCLPNPHLKEISGFYHSVLEIFAFLSCCALQGQHIGPIFRGQCRTDTVQKHGWQTNMPCNNQEKRRSHLLKDSLHIIFWRGFPLLDKDKTSEMFCDLMKVLQKVK